MVRGNAYSRFLPVALGRTALSLVFAIIMLVSFASAQLPAAIYDEIRGITLLETDRDAVRKLLLPASFTMSEGSRSDDFFRENYNIRVEYSSGQCEDTKINEDDLFLGSDVWNVGMGKVVSINVVPKAPTTLSDLGLDLSKFTKENMYRGKHHKVHFNKAMGIAITVVGRLTIELFPQERDHSFLCDNEKIRRHYAKNKWRLQRGPKFICVLISFPPNVIDVVLTPINGDPRELEVAINAQDPENDVLTYYRQISGGRIDSSHGAKAVWNLKDEKPGSYTITVAVDDGGGPRGRYVSRTVVVN